MPVSKPDPVLSVENSVSLIRSRIEEKRLFEARFLARQLGDAIGAREKADLERELTGLLSQVDALQQLARSCLAEGQKDRAARLYSEMEEIAIDVPGLAEEKRAVEGAEAIVARLTTKTPRSDHRRHRLASALVARHVTPPAETEAPVMPQVPAVDEDEHNVFGRPPRNQRKKRPIRIWLTAGLLAILLLVFFIWQGSRHDPSPAPSPPAQNILIRPLIAAPPAETAQPEKEVEPVDPPAAKSVTPTLKLGALQIEEPQSR